MNCKHEHLFYMHEALYLATLAASGGDVPVGAVVVNSSGEIIGRGFNRRERDGDATAHAEIMAIREACHSLSSWRLTDCAIYVTLEPCPMCAGAIMLARLSLLVFGAGDSAMGACGSLLNIPALPFSKPPAVIAGIAEEESRQLLKNFFQSRR